MNYWMQYKTVQCDISIHLGGWLWKFPRKDVTSNKSFIDSYISPFLGSLDFWWCLLWVSKTEWAALFLLGRGIHVTHSLRFTSGTTPANLSAASMASKLISSTYLWADIGGTWNHDLLCNRQMLNWLSYARSALILLLIFVLSLLKSLKGFCLKNPTEVIQFTLITKTLNANTKVINNQQFCKTK